MASPADRGRLLDASLLIAAASLVGYLFALGFWLSYSETFGIPPELVSPSRASIVRVDVLALVAVAVFLVMHGNARAAKLKLVRAILEFLAFFAAYFLLLFSQLLYYALFLASLALMGTDILISWRWPRHARRTEGPAPDWLEALLLAVPARNMLLRYAPFAFTLVVIFGILSGRGNARWKSKFPVLSAPATQSTGRPNEQPDLAVLYTDGDLFVCRAVRPETKYVRGPLRLLDRSTLISQGMTITMKPMCPLCPNSNPK